MPKADKKLIMFIGKTHSGKTTFAKELEKENKELVVLEADPISLFLKEHFPKLIEDSSKEINLKYQTFLLFVESAMSTGKMILLSNSNMYRKGRELIFNLSKKYNYKIQGVYFDYPENTLFERAQISNRNTAVLNRSRDFNELIINQRTRMEIPNSHNFENFFTIKSEAELLKTKADLLQLLN